MRFRRRLKPNATVDLVPMIDVVFQLVIFFMVSSTFIQTPGINLVLPQSSTAEPVLMTEIVVTVASDNVIYLNKQKYDLAGFDQALPRIKQEDNKQKTTVVLEGDRYVTYDFLVKVMDLLRRHGFKEINLKMGKSSQKNDEHQ